MPIYEYVCDRCGARFEKLVRAFSEAVACPGCASPEVTRQLSTFAMASGARAAAPGPTGAGGCCGGGCGCRH